jgi:hypothetical protein
MDWRPRGVLLDTKSLVRGVFDASSNEALLIDAAACGKVELFAHSKSWNAVLWLVMSTLKDESGTPVYSGEKLGVLRESLPIVFTS